MLGDYEEILEGETILRSAPDARHERICARLHDGLSETVARLTSTRILSPRSIVRISPGSMIRPDLSLVTAATGKLWLAVEIINSHDHRVDTVLKKSVYEDLCLPRLWILDPRYDNLEVYHGGQYGLSLQRILAGDDLLEEKLLPGYSETIRGLFAV